MKSSADLRVASVCRDAVSSVHCVSSQVRSGLWLTLHSVIVCHAIPLKLRTSRLAKPPPICCATFWLKVLLSTLKTPLICCMAPPVF